MNNLTTNEKKVLNNLSKELSPSVFLGDRIQALINMLPEYGTPTNAASAVGGFCITDVVKDGETVTINNPAVSGIDVYEFVTDTAKSKTSPTNIAVDIGVFATKSHGTLTMDTQPTSGDTVTIGEKVFIFVPVGTDTADGEVSIGTSLAEAQAALVAAINGTDGVNNPHPLVSASEFTANVSTITALVGGVAGDTIVTTETFTAVSNVFAAATLGSGADAQNGDALTRLSQSVNTFDTQGVDSSIDNMEASITFRSKVEGVIGNSIIISRTIVNSSSMPTGDAMAGGADGTISDGWKIMIDDTYLYICTAANDIHGKNWRSITLDSL